MSSIELVAAALSDGWAIVREANHLFLLKPPFQTSDLRELRQLDVQIAIEKHGFALQQTTFAGWRELVSFVSAQYGDAVEQRRLLLGAADEELSWDALPLIVVAEMLDRVKTDLIDIGETSTANKILVHLLSNDALRQDVDLFRRCQDLLKVCVQNIGHRRNQSPPRSFPGQRVQERGSVWAMGS
jgi:hypothetical protein